MTGEELINYIIDYDLENKLIIIGSPEDVAITGQATEVEYDIANDCIFIY